MTNVSVGKPQERRHTAFRRIGFWLFCTFACFYLLCSSGRVRTPDEYMTLYETESLVLRQSTSVPQALQTQTFYGKYDRNGQPRAPYPPGQAFLASPWYAFGKYVMARVPGVPPSDEDLVVAFSSVLSNSLYAAGAVALCFVILASLGAGVTWSITAAAMLGMATPVFSYSSWFFSEPLTTLIFFVAAYVLFVRDRESQIGMRAAFLGGLLIGAAVLVRPTNILEVALFGVTALFIRDRFSFRTVICFAAGAAIGTLILLSHNAALFGNPFEFGYPVAAEGGKDLNTFHTPLFRGLFGLLLSPGKSIFVFAPPILISMIGLCLLWRQNRGLAIVCGVSLPVYLLFYAQYTQWEGGYCFGPRYLVPEIALFCVALGPALTNGSRLVHRFAWVMAGIGFVVQVIGMATSFLEAEATTGRYYDSNWTYRLSYSLADQVQLFLHYLVDSNAAPLGRGFDRWFVFLYKAGVPAFTIGVLLGIFATALLYSTMRLRQLLLSGRQVGGDSARAT
jgi:hypothetical protein